MYSFEIPGSAPEELLPALAYPEREDFYKLLCRFDRFDQASIVQVTSDVVRLEAQLDANLDKPERRMPSVEQVVFIWAREGGKCAYCKTSVFYIDNVSPDHIIPFSQGGKTRVDNLVCSCRACNIAKGILPPEDFLERLNQPDGKAWRQSRHLAWVRNQNEMYGR